MASYEAIGFKRGRSVMIKLLQYLTENLKLIVKRDKLFYYDVTRPKPCFSTKNARKRKVKNNLVYFGPGIYRRKTKVNCFLKTSEKKMT